MLILSPSPSVRGEGHIHISVYPWEVPFIVNTGSADWVSVCTEFRTLSDLVHAKFVSLLRLCKPFRGPLQICSYVEQMQLFLQLVLEGLFNDGCYWSH